jgi:hypothetical protein
MEPRIANVFLSATNEIQRYTIFFIVVSALNVSSCFSTHHQELKKCTCSIGNCTSADAAYTVFELLYLYKYRCCIHSFGAPDDERKNRSKHVEH